MILSFNPIIEADRNIICAGRDPDEKDLAEIRRAAAVILPQGCMEPLYRMARANCDNVFPNLDVRFDYPAKSGQLRLLRKLNIYHPKTTFFTDVDDLRATKERIDLPVVVKFDWGDEGKTVFKVTDNSQLDSVLTHAGDCERTGQSGILLQEYIPAIHGALRVAVIGTRRMAYWRIPQPPNGFDTTVAGGARLDRHLEPDLQSPAVEVADQFCSLTGLQLAGFDFIFNRRELDKGKIRPLMLEINYFFGRAGLGGSDAYYRILEIEIDQWLSGLSLKR